MFNPLPFIISAVGVYFLFKLRFFFLLHPIRTLSKGVRAIKDRRALRSFILALSGTLGVGNVFGVAFGIIIGGAGSVFWLFLSMFFAMVIKYAEVVISSDNLNHDVDTHGGMFYVIKNSFSRFGNVMSKIYAAGALLLSFFMGAALQCGTVTSSVAAISEIPAFSVATLLAALVVLAILGGTGKIEKITAVLIPLTTMIYIFATSSIILNNIEYLPNVVERIVKSAFYPRSIVGGAVGVLISPAFREGFARGILSNEAGAGTSSIAHARNGVLNPALSGILGMLEVWFDTGLLCMLTGFAILISVPERIVASDGMGLIMYVAGNAYGNVGKYVALLSVFAFAFATVICWYYYGMESWAFVFGKKQRIFFSPLFIIFVFVGSFLNSYYTVFVIDALMAVITLLCVTALIKNSDRIKTLSERGGVIDCDVEKRYLKGIRGSVLPKARKRRDG